MARPHGVNISTRPMTSSARPTYPSTTGTKLSTRPTHTAMRARKPMAGPAAVAAVRIPPRLRARRANTKRTSMALPARMAMGTSSRPTAASRADRAMAVPRVHFTRVGFCCTHLVNFSSNGFTAFISCVSTGASCSPMADLRLKTRFCNITYWADSAALRAAASRAMDPSAPLLLASWRWRASSSGLSTSLARVSLCSMPTSSTITPIRLSSGSCPMAATTLSSVAVASLLIPICTSCDDRPISAMAS